ncbi:MAG: hypothetical protein HS122_09530 [Opitutaceae bacterium]|nr:hypothetical protein [Opitutaceae bacterium]
MSYRSLNSFLCAFAALLSTATLVRSQTPRTAQDENAEAIRLSPFTVEEDRDVGYLAPNSLAGSRLNTSLGDIAASISVFTEEFISDLGASNLTDVLDYANNTVLELNDATSAAAPNNNVLVTGFQEYRVRGLPATRARNFFEYDLPTDTYNVGRIEDARGPNAILFGIAQSGGLINTYTKQAMLNKDFTVINPRVGSHESYRGTIDINRSLIRNKLSFRLNALYDRTNSYRNFMFDLDRRAHLALKWNISPNTSFRAEGEIGTIKANLARPFNLTDASNNWIAAGRPTIDKPVANAQAPTGTSRLPNTARVTYISNTDQFMNMAGRMTTTGSSTILQDPAMTDRSINVVGPITTRSVDFKTYSAFLEHRFSKRTALEFGYNHQYLKNDSRDATVSSSNLVGDPNNFLPDGSRNPYAGKLYLEAGWFRTISEQRSDTARATFTTGFDAGKWGDYRAAVLGEYQDTHDKVDQLGEFWEGAPFNANPISGANLVYRRNYVAEGDWDTYYVNSDLSDGPIVGRTDPISKRSLTSTWLTRQTPADVGTTRESAMAGVQAKYFDRRLVLNAGYRTDRIKTIDPLETTDPVTGLPFADYDNGEKIDFRGNTKTLGAVVHATRAISILGNYSTNIGLPPPRATILGGFKAPNREGEGKDIGLALSLLGGRIYSRLVYYETSGKNQNGARRTQAIGTAVDRILEALVSTGNITQAEASAPGRTTNGATSTVYDMVSDGYEFQVTGNITKNLRLLANFSITDISEQNVSPELKAFIENNMPFWKKYDQSILTGENVTIANEIENITDTLSESTALEGLTAFGNRKYKGSIFARYGFSEGSLKGLSVGLGYRYQSRNVVGVEGTSLIYGNSFWRADAMLGYEMKGFGKDHRIRLQLNVRNLLDETDPLILRYQGTNVRRYKLMDPREWTLSANYMF